MVRGDGALLWDVDDNVYIDYAAGMGPMVLGHNHPAVTAAVKQSLWTGQLFAGQHPLEAEFAETLVGALPWIESIRMGMSGTEMDLLARPNRQGNDRPSQSCAFHRPLPRLARSALRRHGRHRSADGTRAAHSGSVDLGCDRRDLVRVEPHRTGGAGPRGPGDVACVLMEPVMCNTGLIPPMPGYLDGVKTLCHQHGALFVVDEVITGIPPGTLRCPRLPTESAETSSIYAKAIASGFPLAVLGTSTELLAGVGRGEINHSGTYNTGVSSVAAGVATLRVLIDSDPYPEMDRLTCRLVDGLRRLGHELGVGLAVDHIGGSLCQTRFGTPGAVASRADFAANSDNELLACFLASLQDHGVRPTSRGLWFVSAAHDDALIDKTLAAAQQALSRL